MRRLFFIFLLISLLLFFVACSDEDEGDDDDDNDEGDDDDDDTSGDPDYTEPWNEDLPVGEIEITMPESGAFVTTDQVVVRGVVSGGEIPEVWVNDEVVAVTGGAFQTTVAFADGQTVLPIYVATTADAEVFGADKVTVFQGQMSPFDELLTDAMFVTLGDQALDVIGELVGGLLADLDLMPVLEPLNPIIDTESLTLSITSAAVGGSEFAGAFTDGGFGFTGALLDVNLGIEATIGVLPLTLEMTIGRFNFQGLADLLVADGAVSVAITAVDFNHEDLEVTGTLPEGVVDLVLGLVEGVVENVITGTLPGLLEQLLADLHVETTLIGFDLVLELSTLDIDTGALVAGLDLNASLTDPDSTLPWPRGSLYTEGAAPDLLADRPTEAAEFGLGASLGDDLLNRVLLGVADSKLLELAIGGAGTQPDAIELELNAGTLAFVFPSLGSVDPATRASLVLTPMAVPVALPAADGRLTLRVPDWRLAVYLHPEGQAEWLALEMSIDLEMALDADPTNDGALTVALPALGMHAAFLYNPLSDQAPLIDFLVDWLPELLAGLLNSVLPGLPIGLPEIGGVAIDVLYWDTLGENQDYWTAYFGLSYATPESLFLL
jgi:hypothetical protein